MPERDAGYQGVDKREETQGSKTQRHVAMRTCKRRAPDPALMLHQPSEGRSPVQGDKQQFGYAKVRYRG